MRCKPVFTRQGSDGGTFIGEDYKPYMNTLTPCELKVLKEMYEQADGIHKKILFQILHKYGPENLERHTKKYHLGRAGHIIRYLCV